MSYEKYDWRTGEVITEVRLDHMEDGIYDASTGLETKAEIDGVYETMTVGNAEQLVSTQFVEDSEPYVFRTSGGSADIDDREEDTIVGGTVAWNQKVNGDSNFSVTGGTVTSTVNRTATFTASEQGQTVYKSVTTEAHVILASVTYKTAVETSDVVARMFSSDVSGTASTNWQTVYKLVKRGSASGDSIGVKDNRSSDWDAIEVKDFQIFDLTQMFGSAVADAVYAMEQANAGSGVAWFKAQYPLDYYAYNAGELKSVEGLVSHDMVGFNQWDEEWERILYNTSGEKVANNNYIGSKNFIPILPNTVYNFTYAKQTSATSVYFCWYDSDKNFIQRDSTGVSISGNQFTSPSNARYLNFCVGSDTVAITTYEDNITINLSWNGTRNGEYEPYVKRSYPLDSTLTLRGIPKVDADGQMYYDGDTYEADGTVTRKYGVVDLGTLDWQYFSNGEYFGVQGTFFKFRTALLCPIYLDRGARQSMASEPDMTIGTSGGAWINVKNSSYTDATAFKTAMSGVYLVYELATPTTEQAEPYASPQVVEDWGTEEYVTTGIVAVGHHTIYPQNLRDKLQHLPVLAEDDGAYLIQQTGTQMTLVNFRIPKAENLADGTYVLKATVSGGTPTYTWEAE